MTLSLDTSALLKRYIDEPDSDRFGDILDSDPAWLTCRITLVTADLRQAQAGRSPGLEVVGS